MGKKLPFCLGQPSIWNYLVLGLLEKYWDCYYLPLFCPFGQATPAKPFPKLQSCERFCALGELHAYER